jgi:hypothetical protein
MATAILKAVIDAITTAHGTMTTANGYQFDHGSLDQFTYSSKTYPDTEMVYPVNESLDEDESMIERYTQETPIEFVTTIASSADLDHDLLRIESDFGLMFDTNFTTLQAAGLILYDQIGSEIEYTLVDAYPAKIRTRWLLQHRRQKSNPYAT